jgi:hypothetical protein
MKKIIVLIAVIFVAGSLYVSAQENVQEISGYAGGGLSSLRYKPQIGSRKRGAGCNLGAGYTY